MYSMHKNISWETKHSCWVWVDTNRSALDRSRKIRARGCEKNRSASCAEVSFFWLKNSKNSRFYQWVSRFVRGSRRLKLSFISDNVACPIEFRLPNAGLLLGGQSFLLFICDPVAKPKRSDDHQAHENHGWKTKSHSFHVSTYVTFEFW